MHSIVYSYCPPSLRNIFSTNNQREVNHDLRNADLFTIPHPRIELFKKSLLYSIPMEWNALNEGIQFQNNKITFEIALKEHLFSTLIQP
jgi:hypothetical protein